ncbi:MAG TPA: ATP-binding protein [bacterium]|nr:ATP-binding protein [bacterium]HQG44673.1 ATP-binding protein [bacterium]HQI49449.1 ATP-binding protein [bacterium]HQJ63497.1 ATP-binding protein [bacterium]
MIRRRLLMSILAPLLGVLLAAGIYLQYHFRDLLERELGSKLESLALAAGQDMDSGLIAMLRPGDESNRLYSALRERLHAFAAAVGLRRVMLFSPEQGVWLDSEGLAPIASPYVRLHFDRDVIEQALQGQPASSTLFTGSDGRLYKSAYAPLQSEGRRIGVVVVEGSAESLQAVRDSQRVLLQIGLIAAVTALLLAWVLSRRLTRPVARLQQAAERIGRGDLTQAVPATGRDELAFLGRTMEEMRSSLIARNEQQKAMLVGLAHEIRNPLGGIELFAGLIRDDAATATLRQQAERILRETGNLKRLINDFLDYARPLQARPQRCRIRDFWQECGELISADIATSPLSLVLHGDGYAWVDPVHFKQMLLNLLLNAAQSMEKGGRITGVVTLRDGVVALEISDQGRGIAAADQKSIFEPFFSRKEKGMGLGLAMVRNLAAANRARVDLVQSSPAGSCFRLLLPAAPDAGKEKP